MQRLSDPYRVLGVGRDATAVEIKAAHRRLAKRLHPDGPHADANAFLSVQDAYELLSDPLRRTEWDRTHAPGPVRAGESPRSGGARAGRTRGTERPARPAPARPAPARPASAPRDRAAGERADPADAAAAGSGRRPRTARPLDPSAGPDMDPFSRSSGAAWSSASRAFFRRASADMPSGAAHPNTPRWTTPLGGTPPPRYGTPRPRPAGEPSEGVPASDRGVVVPRPRPSQAWPSLIQRAEAGLVAALPPVAVAAFGAFDRLGGARGAEIAALAALTMLWALFFALPRAAWIGARGALGALVGVGSYLVLTLVLPPDTPVFTSFLLGWLIVGAGYLAGVVLALGDVPVRRPWLAPPGGPE